MFRLKQHFAVCLTIKMNFVYDVENEKNLLNKRVLVRTIGFNLNLKS